MPNDASISDEHYRIHGFCAANRSTSLPLLFIWFFFTFFFFVIIASLIILIIIIQNKSRPNERWLIDVFTQSILQFFICVWSRCTKSSLLLHLLFIFFCAVYILSLCDFWRIVQRLIIITIRSIYIFSWFPDYGTSSSSICDNDELVNIENIFCFCCFVSSFFLVWKQNLLTSKHYSLQSPSPFYKMMRRNVFTTYDPNLPSGKKFVAVHVQNEDPLYFLVEVSCSCSIRSNLYFIS